MTCRCNNKKIKLILNHGSILYFNTFKTESDQKSNKITRVRAEVRDCTCYHAPTVTKLDILNRGPNVVP